MMFFKALLSGLILGGFFAFIKLPLPAPASYYGILGIVGITTGYLLIQKIYG